MELTSCGTGRTVEPGEVAGMVRAADTVRDRAGDEHPAIKINTIRDNPNTTIPFRILSFLFELII
jgi:hypothetical protein